MGIITTDDDPMTTSTVMNRQRGEDDDSLSAGLGNTQRGRGGGEFVYLDGRDDIEVNEQDGWVMYVLGFVLFGIVIVAARSRSHRRKRKPQMIYFGPIR